MDRLLADSESMLKHIDQYMISKASKKKSVKIEKPKENPAPAPQRSTRKPVECLLVEADQMIDELFSEIKKDREQWIKATFDPQEASNLTHPNSFIGEVEDTSRLEAMRFFTDSPLSEKNQPHY